MEKEQNAELYEVIKSLYKEGVDEEERRERNLLEVAPEMLRCLKRLTEKIARANNIQHSGGRVSAEDWSELYQITNDAKAIIHKAGGAE